MHSYHIVAELRQFRGVQLASAAVDLDVEIADFLAQCVAVKAEKVGGTDLIAARRGQCRRQEWNLNLLQNPVIKARRGHAVREAGEMRGQIGFDGATEIVDAIGYAVAGGDCRR